MNVTDWYQAEDAEPRQWYSVQNNADDPKTAQVEIYDDIIPFFGVNAADFRNELKALGVRMGEPLFRVRDLVRRHGVRVLSSN